MNRKTIVILAVAALGLGACGTQTSGRPEVNVSTGVSQTGVSVTGTSEVTGTPDTLTVNLGVSVQGDTVSGASSQAADRAEALIAALTSNGVSDDDITTANYSIWPEYEWRNDTQHLIGYRVDNTVRAKIRSIHDAGDVLDAAIAAGGDDVRVDGLSFSIENDTDMIEAAREVAWNDAFQKATQLATLAGQTLGSAVSIDETYSRAPTPIAFDSAGGAEDGLEGVTTPIEPGTSSVTVNIQVRFSLDS